MSNLPGPVTRFRYNQIADGRPGNTGLTGNPGPKGDAGSTGPSGTTFNLATYTVARATSGVSNPVAVVLGASAAGDGAGGQFFWDSTSTLTDDGATVLSVTGVATGRWRRQSATGHTVNVAWFGGLPNANFFNSSDGKWYQDAGLTSESTDDAIKVQAAVTYAVAQGLTGVYLPAGNWYFKTKQTTHEFVRFNAGNITFYGDGDASCITVGPGFNTGASPAGYACVLGNADGLDGASAVDLSGIRFTGFKVDHNAAHNGWNSASFSGQGGFAYANASVMVIKGLGITVDHVTTANFNGAFAIVTGTYGNQPAVGVDYTVNTVSVTDCKFFECGLDVNQGDSSFIAAGAINGTFARNTFRNSTFAPQVTAMEIHGRGCSISHNVVDGMHRGLNLAGDSLDQRNTTVTGNVFTNVDTGITLYSLYARKIVGMSITDNFIGLVKSTLYAAPPNVYGGLTTAYVGGAAGYGGGVYDFKFEGNTVVWTDPTNAAPINVYGFQFLGNTGGGSTNFPTRQNTHAYTGENAISVSGFDYLCKVAGTSAGSSPSFSGAQAFGQTVVDGSATWVCLGSSTAGGGIDVNRNVFSGLGAQAVGIAEGQNANTGNRLYDVRVCDNTIYNCGIYGISITGGSGDSAVQYKRLTVLGNRITDDRGGGSVLSIGVIVTGFTDSSCVVWRNDVFGAASVSEFFDPTNYPTQSQFYPTARVGSLSAQQTGLGTGTQELVTLMNPTAATGGATVQSSPAYALHGQYWAASASHDADVRIWQSPSATPTLIIDRLLDGTSYGILAEIGETNILFASPAFGLEDSGNVSFQVNTVSGYKVINMARAGIPVSPDLTNFFLLASPAQFSQMNVFTGGTVSLTVSGNMRIAADQSNCYAAAPWTWTNQTLSGTASAGGAGALPNVQQYLSVTVNGTAYKIPLVLP